ncbi:MAG: LPS export ABC transporter permease LptG [Candidatus Omnitrophica bacterium]|nr:LPS export ABC transporter permease LptG [Candidatus Omnitrophota bacterium]
MKIIDRYMAKGFLAPFSWCMILFIVMAIIIDIFSFIDDIIKFKIPITSLAAFYVYYTPTIFLQVAPMAALLSSIYLLSNLNKNSEITAMKSSGISLWRILTPLLILGLLISSVVFVVNDKVNPIASRTANYIRREELESRKVKEAKQRVLKNVAVYGIGNRIIFARNYDTEKRTLEDIIIHEQDIAENLTSKITAQRGAWNGGGWTFYKVIVYKIDNAGRILAEPKFHEEKIISLKERPSDFENLEWRADYMSYNELKGYIKNFQNAGTKLIKNLLVDLHYKIAFPFITLIIIMIGAPYAIVNTRGGVLLGIGMSIAIGLLYYASMAIFLAFGRAGILPPFLSAWLGNILFAGWGIYLINKRT